MDPRIKRILVYASLAAGLYAIATFFTESQAAFVAIFVVGLVLGAIADVKWIAHLIRLPWRRRKGTAS